MSNEIEVLDLDLAREQRAAQREGHGDGLPIRIGGKIIATCPAELPIDVFAPLAQIDEALMLLLHEAMQMTTGSDAAAKWESTDMVVGLLASTPRLPVQVIEVAKGIGENLLGVEGFSLFLAARPSKEDIGELVKRILRFYGVSLGEALPSSDSSETGGGTSSTTSSENSTSTPEESSEPPETPDSSESADSLAS